MIKRSYRRDGYQPSVPPLSYFGRRADTIRPYNKWFSSYSLKERKLIRLAHVFEDAVALENIHNALVELGALTQFLNGEKLAVGTCLNYLLRCALSKSAE
mgnify:CR=1 FL=1